MVATAPCAPNVMKVVRSAMAIGRFGGGIPYGQHQH